MTDAKPARPAWLAPESPDPLTDLRGLNEHLTRLRRERETSVSGRAHAFVEDMRAARTLTDAIRAAVDGRDDDLRDLLAELPTDEVMALGAAGQAVADAATHATRGRRS